MNPSFEQTLVEVWRQILVENVKVVVLETERYPVRLTPKSRLRQVDFTFDGNKIRGLEQNPETKSRWAADGTVGQEGDAVPRSRPLYRKCRRWKSYVVRRRGKGASFNRFVGLGTVPGLRGSAIRKTTNRS